MISPSVIEWFGNTDLVVLSRGRDELALDGRILA